MNKFTPNYPIHLYSDDQNYPSHDSEMIDRLIKEHIEFGGVVVYAYRYLGTPNQTRDIVNDLTDPGIAPVIDIGSWLGIQDPLFGENRDRSYDLDHIPRLRGAFKVSQNDIIYGRFGIQGLNNDVFSIEFHTRTIEAQLGRRFIIGDVLEFPHLKDVSVSGNVAPKLYEVARVMKSPGGWDQRYVNHVLGLILRPVRDQQEFIQIMERRDQYGKTLAEQVSVGTNILRMNEALADKAEELAPQSVRDTEGIYLDSDNKHKGIDPWLDDGKAPDGLNYGRGNEFPLNPGNFDYFLRIDMYPNRMFQYYDGFWNIKQIDKNLRWQPYAWVRELNQFLTQDDDDK
jgi:hypothetical protein